MTARSSRLSVVAEVIYSELRNLEHDMRAGRITGAECYLQSRSLNTARDIVTSHAHQLEMKEV
jgi:hypothetical protein